MKKAGKFLKFGLVIFSLSILCSAANAQSGTRSEGKKDVATPVAAHARIHSDGNTDKSTKSQAAVTPTNSKLNAHSMRPANNAASEKATRNCQPKNINKPYSIKRDNFNKLPKDRQQFVLDNLNKYSIVD